MPLKPVKQGIKMWLGSNFFTGYTYDFNVYTGRETGRLDGAVAERVINKMASTAKEKASTCFDHFFTSTDLLQNIVYAAVGNCIQNRKSSRDWKEVVILLTNCHKANVVIISKTMKYGSKNNIPCPEMVATCILWYWYKIQGEPFLKK